MRHYADASFLVSLLNSKDSGHGAALNHYRGHETDDWLVSAWAELESIHVLRQLAVRNPSALKPSESEALRRRFRHYLHHGQFQRSLVDWAEVLTEAHMLSAAWGVRASVRTGDLFHIALAEALDADRFVTADRRQADAAQLMGLTVDWVS